MTVRLGNVTSGIRSTGRRDKATMPISTMEMLSIDIVTGRRTASLGRLMTAPFQAVQVTGR